MASSSKYASIDDTYELDDNDKKPPSVSVHQIGSDDDLEPILPRQDLAPLSHPQWHSQQPDSLGEDPMWEFFFSAYDFFLCFLAFASILKTSLVIYAWHYDRKNSDWRVDNVSLLTLKLLDFNEQVVTVFTIVFITIMTTVTRRLALYKAQQGAYISDLEQLQASVSLPAVIKMVFYLQKFTKFSFMLVGFWCFYYLGSQAARREYAFAPSDSFKDMLGAYPNGNGFTLFDPDYYDPQIAPSSELAAALSSYSSNSKFGLDSLGQFLIPNPEILYYALKRDGTVNNTKEMKVVPSDAWYTSFIGLPLSTAKSYPGTNNTPATTSWGDFGILGDFNLETTYLKIYCESISLHPYEAFPAGVLPTLMVSLNMTNSTGSGPKKLEIWQRWDETFDYFFYGPLPDTSVKKASVKLTCNVVQPRVRLGVHCSETACLVNKLSCPQTSLDVLHKTRFDNSTFTDIFFDSMLLAGGIPKHLNESIDYNKVISAMSLYRIISFYTGSRTNWTNLDADILDPSYYGIESVVNAWYNLGIRNWPMEDAEVKPESGFTPIKFKGNQKRPHYAINWAWIACDYFAGFLLLAAATYSFWLRKHTLAPDIFGFVSSLTRDNPHFPVPPGGSTLDGLDRTRALRDMKVRIGDIGGLQGEVGRVGFIPVHPQVQAMHLTKERKYV